ncbi:nitric oxide-associated protein 1 [Hippocampus zosterae]|uniref:nitric oxide-associated protein 1 n=1 Tax=Hippocampus zosterae TaxID=109293 RepID=UPI00223E1F02|nr:nitric oxide-associated protein 1 [Hippocampus zosterae]
MWNAARVAATLGLALRRSARWSTSLPGSAAASGRASSGQTRGGLERGCTVDPEREERFWFEELADPEEDADADADAAAAGVRWRQSRPPPAHPPRRTRAQRGLKDGPGPEAESLIELGDADFPSAEASGEKKKAAPKDERELYGTADPKPAVGGTGCSGCGAALHCADAAVPGFLPGDKYEALLREGRLRGATCQRCHWLRHRHEALKPRVSKDEFGRAAERIRSGGALVLLVADLLDLPDSIVPQLPHLVGGDKRVVVLGNKIDLLPADSPDYLRRIRRQLGRWCRDAGFGAQVSDVHLISAKTGYGVEALVSGLQRAWKYKGDVYLVGSANAGKSTLFNALLRSDYCKAEACEVVGKATVSPWPGTTLDLLKFPIVNPTPYRMFRRHRRLEECRRETEDDPAPPRPEDLRRRGYLVGHVGQTFLPKVGRGTVAFDPDALAFGEYDDGDDGETPSGDGRRPSAPPPDEPKDSHWLFDTPGIAKERDILGLLDQGEVRAVVPARPIVPRTFVLKPGMSLFVGALARIDFLEGEKSCWFSVMASAQVPVHISSVEKADAVYRKHAGRELLGVPAGGELRMKDFPALVPQDFRLEGRGPAEAAADIKLSSAGWVAVTAFEGQVPLLRLHGPPSAAYGLRTPPLLPHVVSLRGARIPKSAAYKAPTPAALRDGPRRRPKTAKKKGKPRQRHPIKKTLFQPPSGTS